MRRSASDAGRLRGRGWSGAGEGAGAPVAGDEQPGTKTHAEEREEQGEPALEAELRRLHHGVADGAPTGPGRSDAHQRAAGDRAHGGADRKSTRLNSSHVAIS